MAKVESKKINSERKEKKEFNLEIDLKNQDDK
jgi:hypothetical protein